MLNEKKTVDETFEHIYNDTEKKIYGTLRHFFRNNPDVDDIFQNIYFALLKVLQKGASEESARKQIWCIAKNKRIDYWRKTCPNMQCDAYDISDMPDSDWSLQDTQDIYTPGAAIEKAERWQEFDCIVDSLPPQQRTILKMHYYEEMQVSEIADCLGIAEGTVKAHLSNGRKNLKKALIQESERGNRLYGAIGMAGIGDALRAAIECANLPVPTELSQAVFSVLQPIEAATTTAAAATVTESTAASTAAATVTTTATTAATVTATTATAASITTMGGIVLKFTALGVAAKAAIIAGVVVVATAGVGGSLYVHNENVKAEQAAIVEQQKVEEAARISAQQAEQEAAKQEAEEAEKAKAEKEAAARAAVEKEQAAKAEADKQAEAERVAAQQKAAEEAAAKAEAEKAASVKESGKTNTGASSSKPMGSGTKNDSWAAQPGNDPNKEPTEGLGGNGGGSGTKGGATSGPMVGEGSSSGASSGKYLQEAIDVYGAKWKGKSEPSNKSAIPSGRTGVWDSSVGGWRVSVGKYNSIYFPDGNSIGL